MRDVPAQVEDQIVGDDEGDGGCGDRDQFEGAVKNTYKVLLTRGMLGTMVYSTDEETQELLRSLIPDSV